MIAFLLAQVTPGAVEAIEYFDERWLLVAVVFPFVYPFVVKAGAQRWVKLALSLGLSIVAAVVTLLPQLPDLDALTLDSAVTWVASFVGVVQAVYQIADQVVEAAALQEDQGLNDAKVYRPWRGVGREETGRIG